MLKFDPAARKLSKMNATTLANAKILERTDLQAAIVASWEAFSGELGLEEARLLGEEIQPHPSCNDRIDLLAIDTDDRPVVIELKRHRDKLQLLQAVSYAAMVAKWPVERFRTVASTAPPALREALASLVGDDFEPGPPRIILLAESFDAEVILTADWLRGFGVDICAYAVVPLELAGETFLLLDRRFPLAGLDDLYRVRRSRPAAAETGADWDAVLADLRFPFAREAYATFSKLKAGIPRHRRFPHMYARGPFGPMSINLRRDYLKIYNYDQGDEMGDKLRGALGPEVQVDTWGSAESQNSGYTFAIKTREQFQRFMRAVGEGGTT